MARANTVHSAGTGISLTKETGALPPTKHDYAETKRLFKDFCIRVSTIPEFRTRNELALWRTRTIQTALA